MKKEKVQVKICVGTACFVQGGSDLLLYNDFVALVSRPARQAGKVLRMS